MVLASWQKRLLAALAAFVAFGLAVVLAIAGAAPDLTRRMLEARLSGALGTPVSIAAVELRPRRAQIVLHGLSVAGEGAELASIARVVVGVDAPASLRARALTFREVDLEAPSVRLVRLAPGRTNLARVGPALRALARGHPEALARLAALGAADLRLRDARVELDDRVTGWRRARVLARAELPAARGEGAASAAPAFQLSLPPVDPSPAVGLLRDLARDLAPELVPPAGAGRARRLTVQATVHVGRGAGGAVGARLEGALAAAGVQVGGWDLAACTLQGWGLSAEAGQRFTAGFSCTPTAGGRLSGVAEGTLRPLGLEVTARAQDIDLAAVPRAPSRARQPVAAVAGSAGARARFTLAGTLAQPRAGLVDLDLTVSGLGVWVGHGRRRPVARFPLLVARGARLDAGGERLVIDDVSARGGELRLDRLPDGRFEMGWLEALPMPVLIEELSLDGVRVDLRAAGRHALSVGGARLRVVGLSSEPDDEGALSLRGEARLPDGTRLHVEGTTAVRMAPSAPPAVSRR